jgi:hypothetical protein
MYKKINADNLQEFFSICVHLSKESVLLTRPKNSTHCFLPLPPGEGGVRGKISVKLPLILSFSHREKGPKGYDGAHYILFSSVICVSNPLNLFFYKDGCC